MNDNRGSMTYFKSMVSDRTIKDYIHNETENLSQSIHGLFSNIFWQ